MKKKAKESKWERDRRIKREKFNADLRGSRDSLSRLIATGFLPAHGNRAENVEKAHDVISGLCARLGKVK